MAGLYDLFKRFFTPYYLQIIVVFVFSIFSIAGYYLYKNSSDNKSKILDEIHQPKDDINTGKGGSTSESGGSGGSTDKPSAPGKLNIFYIALICLGSLFFVGLIWIVYVKGFGGADNVNVSSMMKTMFAIALAGTVIAAVNIYNKDIEKPWIDSKK